MKTMTRPLSPQVTGWIQGQKGRAEHGAGAGCRSVSTGDKRRGLHLGGGQGTEEGTRGPGERAGVVASTVPRRLVTRPLRRGPFTPGNAGEPGTQTDEEAALARCE